MASRGRLELIEPSDEELALGAPALDVGRACCHPATARSSRPARCRGCRCPPRSRPPAATPPPLGAEAAAREAAAHASAAAAITPSTTASHRLAPPRALSVATAAGAVVAGASADSGRCRLASVSSSTSRASPIACSRWRGLLTRQRSISSRTLGGTVAGSADQIGLALDHLRHRVGHGVTQERAPARQHLVEDHPERPDVGAAVGR